MEFQGSLHSLNLWISRPQNILKIFSNLLRDWEKMVLDSLDIIVSSAITWSLLFQDMRSISMLLEMKTSIFSTSSFSSSDSLDRVTSFSLIDKDRQKAETHYPEKAGVWLISQPFTKSIVRLFLVCCRPVYGSIVRFSIVKRLYPASSQVLSTTHLPFH